MFWRGVFGYLPVQVVQGLVGFGSVVVFTRLLSPQEYGQYALAFSVSALLQSALLTWVEAAMERFHVAESERGDLPAHMATVQWSFAALAVAMTVLAGLALTILTLDHALESAIAWAVTAALVRGGLRLIQQRRRAEGRVFAYALNDVISTAGGFAFGVLLARSGFGGAAPAAGAAAGAVLLLLIAAPGELRRARGGRFELGRARRYAAFGVPVSLSLVMGVVYSGTDRLLIAAFIDEASVGAYHAGYGLADRTLDILFIWLGLAGAPAVIAALEREGPAAMRDAARTQAELMTLIALPAAAGLALVAQPLAEVMIGERLREPAARIIPWIAFSGLLAGFKAYYFDQAFTLAGRSSYLLWCMVIAAVLNVLLNLLLIPRLGLDGAVIATTLSIGAGLAASYGLGLRVLPLPIPWDTLARCGVAVAGMAGGLLTVPDIGGVPELVLKTVTGVLVYGVLALGLDAGGVRRRILDLSARLRRSAPATPRTQP